jgi:hypothetical protein
VNKPHFFFSQHTHCKKKKKKSFRWLTNEHRCEWDRRRNPSAMSIRLHSTKRKRTIIQKRRHTPRDSATPVGLVEGRARRRRSGPLSEQFCESSRICRPSSRSVRLLWLRRAQPALLCQRRPHRCYRERRHGLVEGRPQGPRWTFSKKFHRGTSLLSCLPDSSCRRTALEQSRFASLSCRHQCSGFASC